MLDVAAPAICEQCNTHPVSYTEAKLCARCSLRNLNDMVRRDGNTEAADTMAVIYHDSVPQEWVEWALQELRTNVWKPTPLVIGGKVVNANA